MSHSADPPNSVEPPQGFFALGLQVIQEVAVAELHPPTHGSEHAQGGFLPTPSVAGVTLIPGGETEPTTVCASGAQVGPGLGVPSSTQCTETPPPVNSQLLVAAKPKPRSF